MTNGLDESKIFSWNSTLFSPTSQGLSMKRSKNFDDVIEFDANAFLRAIVDIGDDGEMAQVKIGDSPPMSHPVVEKTKQEISAARKKKII